MNPKLSSAPWRAETFLPILLFLPIPVGAILGGLNQTRFGFRARSRTEYSVAVAALLLHTLTFWAESQWPLALWKIMIPSVAIFYLVIGIRRSIHSLLRYRF